MDADGNEITHSPIEHEHELNLEQHSRTESIITEFNERDEVIRQVVYSTTEFRPKSFVDPHTGFYL